MGISVPALPRPELHRHRPRPPLRSAEAAQRTRRMSRAGSFEESSEARLSLYEELHLGDPTRRAHRKGDVDVDDVTEPRTGVAEAATEAHVLEHAIVWWGERSGAPGASRVEENRSAHAKEPE